MAVLGKPLPEAKLVHVASSAVGSPLIITIRRCKLQVGDKLLAQLLFSSAEAWNLLNAPKARNLVPDLLGPFN